MTFVPNVIPKDDKTAIYLILTGLIAAGCVPTSVYDGEESHDYTSVEKALDDLTAADEGTLYLDLPDGGSTFAYFVLGNEPIEVLCDHGVSLSPYVDPITEPWWE